MTRNKIPQKEKMRLPGLSISSEIIVPLFTASHPNIIKCKHRSHAFTKFHFIVKYLYLPGSFILRWPRPEIGFGICSGLNGSGREDTFASGVPEWMDFFGEFGINISLSSSISDLLKSSLLTSELIFWKQDTFRETSLFTFIIGPFLVVTIPGLSYFDCNFPWYSSQLNLQL